MAEKKISELNEATTANDGDYLPIVQSGETKKITKENLLNGVGGGGTWGSITGTLSSQTDLQTALTNKVDKVTGKGLSANDYDNTAKTKVDAIDQVYTSTEKTKLSGISANAIALSALSASSPLSYNNTTGSFSLQQANGSQNGYLSSSDWTTFNGKQSALSAGAGISISGGTIACTITNNNQLTNGAGFITGINSSMVTTALGYTPLNRAGDTLSGNIVLGSNNTYSIGGSTLALSAAYSRLVASDNTSGTDIAGTDITIQAGKGTGGGVKSTTNIGALINFQAPQISTTGSTAQTLGNAMSVGYFNSGSVASPTNTSAIWLNVTPSDSNYTLLRNSNALFFNAPSSGTLYFRAGGADKMNLPSTGGLSISASLTTTYRLTAAGSNVTPFLLVDPQGNFGAGGGSLTYDNTNGLCFNMANGSNRIRRASFLLTNNTNTSGSELSDLELTMITGGSFIFSNILFYNGVPASNPASGKIYLYNDSGTLKARGASGTVTTIAVP